MNGDVIKKTSDDLTKTFLSIKPEQIYTEVYISVQRDNHIMDRRLSLIDAKRFFNIDYVMEVFISNLMLV